MTSKQSSLKRKSHSRPLARRLISRDSNGSVSAAPTPIEEELNGSGNGHTVDVYNPNSHSGGEAKFVPWLEKDPVYSPSQTEHNSPASTPPVSARPTYLMQQAQLPPGARRPTRPTIDIDITPRTVTPPPPSPRIRWEHLRQHVLPTSPPPPGPPPLQPQSTGSSLTSLTSTSTATFSPPPIPRLAAPIPKPSRLARLGFRQVVDTARQVAEDASRRCAEDVHRACWGAKMGDPRAKMEREGSLAALGSNLYLPFMSSSALPSTNQSSTSLALSQKGAARRPPSILSLATTYQPSSLVGLNGVVARYAAMSQNHNGGVGMVMAVFPNEHDVLSTLLAPFLITEAGPEADENRALALDTFECIVKTWKAPNIEGEIERCIWCCKAALVPPSLVRSRLLNLLSTALLGPQLINSVVALNTVTAALVELLPYFGRFPSSGADTSIVIDIISNVFNGKHGFFPMATLETKYGIPAGDTAPEKDIRLAVSIEAVLRCLEYGSLTACEWILQNVVERFWPLPPILDRYTPLQTKVHLSKSNTFLRCAARIGEMSSEEGRELNVEVIYNVVVHRIVPEFKSMAQSETGPTRGGVVKLVLGMTKLRSEVQSELVDLVGEWLGKDGGEWGEAIKSGLEQTVRSTTWEEVIQIGSTLNLKLPDRARRTFAALFVPRLQEQLSIIQPPYPCPALTEFLDALSRSFPQIFFKCMFSCAAATKDTIVIRQLRILVALSRFLPDLWIRDAEMMSVVLMTDPEGDGFRTKDREKEKGRPTRSARARLGQTLILLELIGRIREARMAPKEAALHGALIKFFGGIENRLAILIEAKERECWIPQSLRLLFVVFFYEVRLYSRSLKTAPWLPKIVSWTLDFRRGNDTSVPSTPLSPGSNFDDPNWEVHDTFAKVRAVYIACKADAFSVRQQILLSPKAALKSFREELKDPTSNLFSAREKVLAGVHQNSMLPMLELLVAMCGLLTNTDFVELGVLVWETGLGEVDSRFLSAACFLAMQCIEKAPGELLKVIDRDLTNPAPFIRRDAVIRLGVLFTWRFQLLGLTYITDRNHRRPFKLARPPISFVPTDMGSKTFVFDRDADDVAAGPEHNLPSDLRRRLSEMGWTDETNQVDPDLVWARTPISLLPFHRVDDIADASRPNTPSPSPTPSQGQNGTRSQASSPSPDALVRRNSSSAGYLQGVKRRPVLVQPLLPVFLRLITLVLDGDLSVSSLARDMIFDFMRDDPSTLSRPVMDIFSNNLEDVGKAISTLQLFFHSRRALPPPLTHHLFNHLAGFLKSSSRESEDEEALTHYAMIVPILAKLVGQVNYLTIRDLKRSKIDHLLFPTGHLWFPNSAPTGPMFPRLPSTLDPFSDSDSGRLVWITMIRTAQNMFLLSMVKRNPQDAQVMRKNISRLVLPSSDTNLDDESLSALSFEQRGAAFARHEDDPFLLLSLAFSASHLLLVAQVFRSMSRHLNDPRELENILDGVNRVLIRHHSDIGIVSHAIIVYMIASTRFRRLMTSSTSFSIFLPTLFRVYCVSESHSSVRMAIEYAANRFYAVHEEAFILQLLDVVASVVVDCPEKGDWVAKHLHRLLSALKRNHIHAPSISGIRNATRDQEEETALAITADERPQVFLASLRKDGKIRAEDLEPSSSSSKPVEIFDGKFFQLDNLVRMLLTVIAHDPSSIRARHFMRLFRFLIPHLAKTSHTVRALLKDGIHALGNILSANLKAAKGKQTHTESEKLDVEGLLEKEASRSTGNILTMRQDYLLSFPAFLDAGGRFSLSSVQKAFEIAKLVLKEGSLVGIQAVECFCKSQAESVVNTEERSLIRNILRDLAVVVNAFGSVADFSDIFKVLVGLSQNAVFANETVYAKVAVSELFNAGIQACSLAASEKRLFCLPLRQSAVSALSSSFCLLESDGSVELEKCAPTAGFLAGVVLPFALSLRTTAELSAEGVWGDSWRRDAHVRAWVRLLSYVMGSCRRSSGHRRSHPLAFRTDEKQREVDAADRSPSRLIIGIQIIKIIAIRAEEDLAETIPGIWNRIAAFLSKRLRDGNASFALPMKGTNANASPTASPMHSPRVSIDFRESFGTDPDQTTAMSFKVRTPRPRVVDYALWSLFEFLQLRRSPLVLQLRMFMREKVHTIYDGQGQVQGQGRANAYLSGISSYAPTSRRQRVTSSVFAKPRVKSSISGPNSARTTPEASPLLGPTTTFSEGTFPTLPSGLSLAPLDDSASQAGIHINRSANASPSNLHLGDSMGTISKGQGFVNIRSLGPAHAYASTLRGTSPGPSTATAAANTNTATDSTMDEDDFLNEAAKQTKIESPDLIRKTYERIRFVQAKMGYTTLLPVAEDMEETNPAGQTQTLSMNGALEMVLKETRELLKEFKAELTMNADEEFDEVYFLS